MSSDGSLLAMITHSSQVHVLSSSLMEVIKTLSAPAVVTSLQFLPNSNQKIQAMTERGEVAIWITLNGSRHVFWAIALVVEQAHFNHDRWAKVRADCAADVCQLHPADVGTSFPDSAREAVHLNFTMS
ncbi:hypothetical protein KIN20_024370 [Parelaphostrongylus tenuis]|uniref:Uncharacterized protein n=1 Tax=Parelaphostrongylus tenuis TaxID=148309 RepID=A0AAD5N9Y3_PARTN|nr:hypothetical protein KIN20_024370 [Parelaphostrongylus tenuis]